MPSALPPRSVHLQKMDLLNDPFLNKGTAFSLEERNAFHLHGLLPAGVQTLDEQVAQAYNNIMALPDVLAKHVHIRSIQDTNETLFHTLLERHLKEMMPIVYTPGVGKACQEFSKIWQRPRGLFLSSADKGKIAERLAAIADRKSVV